MTPQYHPTYLTLIPMPNLIPHYHKPPLHKYHDFHSSLTYSSLYLKLTSSPTSSPTLTYRHNTQLTAIPPTSHHKAFPINTFQCSYSTHQPHVIIYLHNTSMTSLASLTPTRHRYVYNNTSPSSPHSTASPDSPTRSMTSPMTV